MDFICLNQFQKDVPDEKLGSAKAMTELDYEKIVKHYGCPTNCKNTTTLQLL